MAPTTTTRFFTALLVILAARSRGAARIVFLALLITSSSSSCGPIATSVVGAVAAATVVGRELEGAFAGLLVDEDPATGGLVPAGDPGRGDLRRGLVAVRVLLLLLGGAAAGVGELVDEFADEAGHGWVRAWLVCGVERLRALDNLDCYSFMV